MEWGRVFDNYCERLGPGFWAEPINAITNLAFIVAAVVALRAARVEGRLDWPVAALIVVTAMVGIGSFLFHTYATLWALLADVIPIQLFIILYFALAMRRFAGFPWIVSIVATAAFVGGSFVAADALDEAVGDRLNGSEGYIPPLSALVVVGALLIVAGRRPQGAALLLASAIFAVSLTFRTIDASVCPAFPLGTHFLWHVLNGVLLGVLILAMVRLGRHAPRAASPPERAA